MNAPLYTTEILRLAASLPDPVALEPANGSASLRSPTCGSTVETHVQLKAGRIAALSQRVHACAFGQASAALVAKQAPGCDRADVESALAQLTEWLSCEGAGLSGWRSFEALAPALNRKARHGAILLPLRALAAALESAE